MVNGIDLSRHNGNVDFSKVKKAGYSFVILRAGYGRTYKDSTFDTNIKNAIANGLKVGVYWFIYANSVENVVLNAKKCYEVLKSYKKEITLKVWADWEYDSDKQAGYLTNNQRTDLVVNFLNEMKKYGFECGVYANPDYIKSKFEWQRLDHYPLWIAKYAKDLGAYKPYMWQYSSKGSVPGIVGNVDLNYGYFDSAEIMPTLRKGSKGEYVLLLQKLLNDKIQAYLVCDSSFGQLTYNKVIEFQGLNNLTKDGIVGKKTWAKLLEN